MTATPGSRRTPLIVIGLVVAGIGVIAAAGLWMASSSRLDDAVGKLAPAPVGCETELEFDHPGTFYIFAETSGSVGELDGDCENDERDYDGGEADFDVELIGEEDGEQVNVDVEDEDGISYDAGSASGEVIYSFEVDRDRDSTYQLRVTGDPDNEVVARVGGDPNEGVGMLKAGAVIALIVGLVVGGVLFGLGMRRRAVGPPQAAPATPTQWRPPPDPGRETAPVGPPLSHGPVQTGHAPPPSAPRPPPAGGPSGVPGQPGLPGQPRQPGSPPPGPQPPPPSDPPPSWGPPSG